MRNDISEYVNKCQDCQAVKTYKKIRPVMGSIPVPDERFSSLQIDVVGPMTASENMMYLLTIFDRTTRWVEAVPMPEASAWECCDAFLSRWVQRFFSCQK